MRAGDRVRLRSTTSGVPAGTEGQVFGVYRRDGREEVVVALDGRVVIVPRDEVHVVAERSRGDEPAP